MTEEKIFGSFECKENQPISLQKSATILGEGAFSTVRYYTDNNDPTRKYIGKSSTLLLNRDQTPENPLVASMIKNELNLLLKLKRKCEDVFLCLDQCYVSMEPTDDGRWEKEYLFLFPDNPDFQTLDRYTSNLPQWTFREKIYLCQALAEGLEKLHSIDIIHRDIKPENILVKKEEDNRLKIKYIDYGLSCIDVRPTTLSPTCLLGVPVGTPGYQPPEQTICSTDLKQSDTWSLGIVFYFIWNNGKPPVWEGRAGAGWTRFVQRYCNSESSSNYACIKNEAFDQFFGSSDNHTAETELKTLIQWMTVGPMVDRPFLSNVIGDLTKVILAEKEDRWWDKETKNDPLPLLPLSPRESRFVSEDIPLSPRESRFVTYDIPLSPRESRFDTYDIPPE
jgi:serine/threonine protein kinase